MSPLHHPKNLPTTQTSRQPTLNLQELHHKLTQLEKNQSAQENQDNGDKNQEKDQSSHEHPFISAGLENDETHSRKRKRVLNLPLEKQKQKGGKKAMLTTGSSSAGTKNIRTTKLPSSRVSFTSGKQLNSKELTSSAITPTPANNTTSQLQKKLAKQQIRQKEALLMQISKLESMMSGVSEQNNQQGGMNVENDDNHGTFDNTEQQPSHYSNLLKHVEESSENRSVLLKELQQWVVEKLTPKVEEGTDEDQIYESSGANEVSSTQRQRTEVQPQQKRAPKRHAAPSEEDSTTFSSIYREESIEDLDEMDEYEEITQPPDGSSGDDESSGDEDSDEEYYRHTHYQDIHYYGSSNSLTSAEVMPSPVHQSSSDEQPSTQNPQIFHSGAPTNQHRWSHPPNAGHPVIDTDTSSINSMRDYSPLSNVSKMGTPGSARNQHDNAQHFTPTLHDIPVQHLTTNTPLHPSPRQKPTSDELRLERYVQVLKKENLSLGQNYMKAMEQNEELLQDVDILSEKYRHCNERMVTLEKIIEQKQQEMEKKEKSFEKRMRYMSGQINAKDADKHRLQEDLTSQVEHLKLQVESRNKQIMDQERRLEDNEKAAQDYEKRIAKLKEVNRERMDKVLQMENVRRAQEMEISMKAQQKAALEQEQQRLVSEISSLNADKQQLEENIVEQEEEIKQLHNKIPSEPFKLTAQTSHVSIQTSTVDPSVVEQQISLRQQFERVMSDYCDLNRRSCIRVRHSHDEFVAQMLHEVKHQIADTTIQFLNEFGATNHVDTLAIDEWIGRFHGVYARHISATQILCEQQYNTYKQAFKQNEMSSSRERLLELSHVLFFENGEARDDPQEPSNPEAAHSRLSPTSSASNNELPLSLTPAEDQCITSRMYQDIKLELDEARKRLLDLEEDNGMFKNQLKVMEATQGKLSNVAEMERQLKRAQIRSQTLEEECREYQEKCDALEAQLEELQMRLKKSGMVSLDADPPFDYDSETEDDVSHDTSQAGRITEFQVYEDGKLVNTSSDADKRQRNESFQDKVLMETKAFASVSRPSNHQSFEYDPTTHDMHIKLERAMVEAKTQKQYSKFSRLIRQLKTQINEIHQSMRLLLTKLDQHEVNKLEQEEANDDGAPSWLRKLLQERSNDLMRASERLISRYAKAVESTDKKIQDFVREPITLFNSAEDKITEKDLYKFKDNYELQFLKITEHALQQKLDAMMTEACRKYPLRAVDEESISAHVATFLSRQLPVVSEVLMVVLNKMLTLHRACTDYIDRLLQEKREMGLGASHHMSGTDNWSNSSFGDGSSMMMDTSTSSGARANVLKYIYPTPSKEPPVELNRFQAQRKELFSRRRSEQLSEEGSIQEPRLPRTKHSDRSSFSLYGYVDQESEMSDTLPPPALHAMHILEHEKHLRSLRVQTRFCYWIYRKNLLKLEAEIYAVQSGTTESSNNVLLRNLNAMRKYQQGRCERKRKQLEQLQAQHKRNVRSALHSLTEFIQITKQAKTLHKHSNETMSNAEKDGTKPASSVGLDSSLLTQSSRYVPSKLFSSSRLKLQSREPLDREKLTQLPPKPTGLTAGSARRHSSNPSLIEQKASSFSIFRPKNASGSDQSMKLSSTLPPVFEDPNLAARKAFVGVKPPKKLARSIASAPSTQQHTGGKPHRLRKTRGGLPRVNQMSS